MHKFLASETATIARRRLQGRLYVAQCTVSGSERSFTKNLSFKVKTELFNKQGTTPIYPQTRGIFLIVQPQKIFQQPRNWRWILFFVLKIVLIGVKYFHRALKFFISFESQWQLVISLQFFMSLINQVLASSVSRGSLE